MYDTGGQGAEFASSGVRMNMIPKEGGNRFVAEGIAYAHALEHDGGRGLLHRDISPDNVMVGYDGRSKVTDFGIARLEGHTRLTTTGQVRGKLSYLSPELAEGGEPSFASDVRPAETLKARKPSLKIGMIGAKVAVEPEKSLQASPAIDFVARNEFDFTIREVAEGRDFGRIAGLSWRNADGVIVHNDDRAVLENMDELPFVTPVYKRDLVIENYFIGYLNHPYISFYSGRGCKSRCTFCLWPQTIGGHRYRTRSVGHVVEELAWAQKAFPQVKEFFFDDDTLTDNLPRVEALAREIGKLGIVDCDDDDQEDDDVDAVTVGAHGNPRPKPPPADDIGAEIPF